MVHHFQIILVLQIHNKTQVLQISYSSVFHAPPQYNVTPYFMPSSQNNVTPNFPYAPLYYLTMSGQFMSQPSQVFSPPPSRASTKYLNK